jgi:hypothetical protein
MTLERDGPKRNLLRRLIRRTDVSAEVMRASDYGACWGSSGFSVKRLGDDLSLTTCVD